MSDYVCYCLLKGSTGSRAMTRRLFELQEYFEEAGAPQLPRQAFVYGDKEAVCLPFKTWPKGWRTGIDARMSRCRTQDMLALSWRLLASAMEEHPESVFYLVILADGPEAAEEESVEIMLDNLRSLGKKGLRIIFAACTPEADSGRIRSVASAEISAGEDAGSVLRD